MWSGCPTSGRSGEGTPLAVTTQSPPHLMRPYELYTFKRSWHLVTNYKEHRWNTCSVDRPWGQGAGA